MFTQIQWKDLKMKNKLYYKEESKTEFERIFFYLFVCLLFMGFLIGLYDPRETNIMFKVNDNLTKEGAFLNEHYESGLEQSASYFIIGFMGIVISLGIFFGSPFSFLNYLSLPLTVIFVAWSIDYIFQFGWTKVVINKINSTIQNTAKL